MVDSFPFVLLYCTWIDGFKKGQLERVHGPDELQVEGDGQVAVRNQLVSTLANSRSSSKSPKQNKIERLSLVSFIRQQFTP